MLGILLSILKIFGIIILSILGLLILIILVVLFVPIRYRAKGSYKDNVFNAKAVVSYILHIFTAVVLFDSKLDYYIRLFGIKINLKNRKKKAVVDSKNGNEQSDKEEAIDDHQDDTSNIDDSADTDNEEISVTTDNKGDIGNTDNTEESKTKPSLKDRKADIDFYLDLIQKDETKAAFHTCKERIGRMLKSVLPYKGKIYIAFGTGDAGLVGEIFGFYEALFPYIGNVITFVPYFTDKYVEVSFDIKGRIRAISVLYQLIRIYFDKNCHRLIKILIKKNRRK